MSAPFRNVHRGLALLVVGGCLTHPELNTTTPVRTDHSATAVHAEPTAPARPMAREDRPTFEDGGGSALDAFHRALERAAAGDGQARILVYGASHVASDLFTGPLRAELQRRYGDAGPGFVLPVKPWRFYRHGDLSFEGDWRRWRRQRVRVNDHEPSLYGLAGVYVETDLPGAHGIVRRRRRHSSRGPESYEVYYLAQPNGGSFSVWIDGVRRARVSTRAPVEQAAYALYETRKGAEEFKVQVHGGGPVRFFGVAIERPSSGVVIDTLGINGARARYQLLWDEALHREHLARRRPDLVVLAYGTNESGDNRPVSDYEADLRKVVDRVRTTVPHASCMLIGPSDRPLRTDEGVFEARPRQADIIETQRRVALDEGCAFFDLVAFQGGPGSMVDWVQAEPPLGAPDYVHFTSEGYNQLGKQLFEHLLEGVTVAQKLAQQAGP